MHAHSQEAIIVATLLALSMQQASLNQSINRSLTRSLTHLLTHSLIRWLPETYKAPTCTSLINGHIKCRMHASTAKQRDDRLLPQMLQAYCIVLCRAVTRHILPYHVPSNHFATHCTASWYVIQRPTMYCRVDSPSLRSPSPPSRRFSHPSYNLSDAGQILSLCISPIVHPLATPPLIPSTRELCVPDVPDIIHYIPWFLRYSFNSMESCTSSSLRSCTNYFPPLSISPLPSFLISPSFPSPSFSLSQAFSPRFDPDRQCTYLVSAVNTSPMAQELGHHPSMSVMNSPHKCRRAVLMYQDLLWYSLHALIWHVVVNQSVKECVTKAGYTRPCGARYMITTTTIHLQCSFDMDMKITIDWPTQLIP